MLISLSRISSISVSWCPDCLKCGGTASSVLFCCYDSAVFSVQCIPGATAG